MIRFLAIALLGFAPQDEGRDGPYQRLHENGQVAAEGALADGRPQGPWRTYYVDGTQRSSGEFNEGRRVGAWELFHPNGQLAASGRYRLGLRDRKWVYLTAEGEKIEADSGLYRTDSELYENRQKRFMAETLDDRRHGRFVSWWENGARQLEGDYRAGRRHGWWTLWHMDGSIEPDFVTGFYVDGRRVEPGAEVDVRDPFAIVEEQPSRAVPDAEPGSVALPRLGRPAWVKLSQRTTHKEWIGRFLDDPDELERAKAEQILLHYGRDAVPDVLNRFAELDLELTGDGTAARRLHGLLRGACKGRGFEWSGDVAALESDQRARSRWFSWWGFTGADEVWWQRLAANDVPRELLSAVLIDGLLPVLPPPEAARTAEEVRAAPLELEARSSELFRARARGRRRKDVGPAIAESLRWLAGHQSVDGSWDCDGFELECQRRGQPECDGPGIREADVGVTALALLAFLADGNTSSSGKHPQVVVAAVRWLVSQQNPSTGLIGQPQGHEFIYGHAIATLALAEVARFTDSRRLAESLQAAVDLIHAARNPNGAWRYYVPPNGEEDTSVTGWMVHALHAAEQAGAEVDPATYAAAATWIAAVTREEDARVGYDALGSASARVHGINEHFPREQGEAMTAVGLFTSYLLGDRPRSHPVLARQADLLLNQLPEWVPSEFDCDMYYWYHATNAMFRVGGSHWDRWHTALERAVLPVQRDDECLAGSWDPVGPWGYSGGRVYSTAILTLCLQGGFRYPRESQ